MRIAVSLTCALALGAASLCADSAAAQGTQAQASASSTAPQSGDSGRSIPETAEKGEQEVTPEEDEASTDPMGWLGIGVKLGLGYVGSSEIAMDAASLGLAPSVNGMQLNYEHTFVTPRRTGLQLSIPINIGGDGFGWIVEPYFHFADYKATGIYTGPTFNLHIADPVYFGFGFGFKGAILNADVLDFGLDLGGRIPFTLTIYLANAMALVAEVGIGYTATGLSLKPAPGMEAGDLSFGGAFAWDFGVGVRFP